MATPRKKPEDRVKTGRPSLYDPSYCQLIQNLGKKGYMPIMLASELGVCKQTLHDWCAGHPEFLDAYNKSKVNSQAYLLKHSIDKANGANPLADSTMLKFLLSAGYGMSESSHVTSEANVNVKGSLSIEWGGEED